MIAWKTGWARTITALSPLTATAPWTAFGVLSHGLTSSYFVT